MKIIVPIKQVPETKSVKMDEETGTVIRDGVAAIVNPLDLYAIEIAIQLKEQYGGEIVAISMGPPKAETALREAIAMGIDSAVLVSDKKFGGSDTWATSYIISAAIRNIGEFDLIICGERATDGDTGQVGPGIAAFLDLPVLSYVNKVEKINDNRCYAHRLVEDGSEILSSSLPALLTVVKEVSEPRLPTLRGKQKAKKSEIPVWDNQKLNIDQNKIGLQGSPTRDVKIFRPKVTRKCELVFAGDEAQIQNSASRLTAFLTGKELI